jgi:hypothetical protein
MGPTGLEDLAGFVDSGILLSSPAPASNVAVELALRGLSAEGLGRHSAMAFYSMRAAAIPIYVEKWNP